MQNRDVSHPIARGLRDPGDWAMRVAAGLYLLPVLHDRLDSAAVVRATLEALDPAAVAVELPTTLAEGAERAVRRLPSISVVISETPGEDALLWTVAPGDPLAEGLRWARERNRQRVFIDPDLPYRERHPDPVPDPHALWHLGGRYLELLAESAAGRSPSEVDLRREAGMAHHLERARSALGNGRLVALVGAAHLHRLAERLRRPAAIPLARVRREAVEVRHLHPRSLTALLPDPPLAHAAWELLRDGEIPVEPDLPAVTARCLSLLPPRGPAGPRPVDPAPGDRQASDRRRHIAEMAAARGARRGFGDRPALDRRRLGRTVWSVAAASYEQQTGETLAPWQRRLFFDYTGRYARLQGLLVPGLYEWVVGARGVADDNLAWEVLQTARAYPWQDEEAEIGTAEIDGDELDLGTRRVRFRRRFFRVKQRPVAALPLQERPTPEDPKEWLSGFRPGAGLCSYPPEDLVVEDYGRFLRARAEGLLSAELARSEPFSSSLLDGIDLRETLRRPDDGRLWVRELRRVPGRAGSVVVLFDSGPAEDRYPYRMTWLGEHEDESDMAFYSTHPASQVVGPGILRATYGGFLMTWPPGRLYDVWLDPDYRSARTAGEVLVRAGIDYSEDRLVAHVAARPPGRGLHAYAVSRGKRLVHIPLGSLSPQVLRKIRVLHILAGHDRRAVANQYIW
ncbi:MAG: hypothetical protein AAF481_02340 [Acidobacteriota bacterium]